MSFVDGSINPSSPIMLIPPPIYLLPTLITWLVWARPNHSKLNSCHHFSCCFRVNAWTHHFLCHVVKALKDICVKLSNMYHQLKFKLQTIRCKNLTLTKYLENTKSLSGSLSVAGHPIKETNLIFYTLGGLALDFESFIMSVTSQKDIITIEGHRRSALPPSHPRASSNTHLSIVCLRHLLHTNGQCCNPDY